MKENSSETKLLVSEGMDKFQKEQADPQLLTPDDAWVLPGTRIHKVWGRTGEHASVRDTSENNLSYLNLNICFSHICS